MLTTVLTRAFCSRWRCDRALGEKNIENLSDRGALTIKPNGEMCLNNKPINSFNFNRNTRKACNNIAKSILGQQAAQQDSSSEASGQGRLTRIAKYWTNRAQKKEKDKQNKKIKILKGKREKLEKKRIELTTEFKELERERYKAEALKSVGRTEECHKLNTEYQTKKQRLDKKIETHAREMGRVQLELKSLNAQEHHDIKDELTKQSKEELEGELRIVQGKLDTINREIDDKEDEYQWQALDNLKLQPHSAKAMEEVINVREDLATLEEQQKSLQEKQRSLQEKIKSLGNQAPQRPVDETGDAEETLVDDAVPPTSPSTSRQGDVVGAVSDENKDDSNSSPSIRGADNPALARREGPLAPAPGTVEPKPLRSEAEDQKILRTMNKIKRLNKENNSLNARLKELQKELAELKRQPKKQIDEQQRVQQEIHDLQIKIADNQERIGELENKLSDTG